MRIGMVVLALLPSVGVAQEWVALDGPAITAALTARVLAYEGGATQNFFADGRTLYETDGAQWGQWRVQGDRYCSVWPPSDRWSCYDVQAGGLDVRFVSDGGEISTGRYIDLQ